MDALKFTAEALQIDELPDVLAKEQAVEAVRQALQYQSDTQSDLDETRITYLRKALSEIEAITKDPVVALIAKRALVTDEE